MKKNAGAYLGIIDWGIGGTSVYKAIKAKRPHTPILYFSDTGVTPYGRLGKKELLARLQAVMDELVSRGVTHLVIGCNAASTALDHLHRDDLIITGIIDPAVRFLQKKKIRQIGLIGGKRTVLSRAYSRRLAASGTKVRGRVAQPLSALIEKGDLDSAAVHAACGKILGPIRNEKKILIACTHYPAILPVLQQHVSAATEFIDPLQALVGEVLRMPGLPGGKQPDIFLTSGDAKAMQVAAKKVFGVIIQSPKTISI